MRHGALSRASSRGNALYLVAGFLLLAGQGCHDAATPTEQVPRPAFDVVAGDGATGDGLVPPGDTIPGEGHGSHQVILTQSGVLECRKTTFEGGVHFAEIHPENGYLISGSNVRFPGWRTLITGPVFNKPSPVTVAFWTLIGLSRDITFDQPVASASLWYASRPDVMLTAYDVSGTALTSAVGPANALPTFDTWNQVSVDVQQNAITRVTVQGRQNQTAIDDFESCRVIAIQVEIDIKPGSDPNCFNNDGHGTIPVAILGRADFDVSAIDPGTATLTGNLYDGTPIVGSDNICVVPGA